MKNLVLFRKNLRICDNPALFKACEDGMILPVYLHDDNSLNRPLGAASKYWLHHALKSLDNDLNKQLGTLKQPQFLNEPIDHLLYRDSIDEIII